MIDSEKHIKLFKQVLNSYGPIGQVSFDKIIDLAKFRVVNKGDVILLKGQIAKKNVFCVRRYFNFSVDRSRG